jgi:ribonucleoside-diphosphate reductase alpha chain
MLRPDQQSSKKTSPPISGASPDGSAEPQTNLKQGLRIARRFTEAGSHPYDALEWERRDAVITNERGEVTFEQRNVEVPKHWSQLATNVVAQKYFRGQLGTPERESSVRSSIAWSRQR